MKNSYLFLLVASLLVSAVHTLGFGQQLDVTITPPHLKACNSNIYEIYISNNSTNSISGPITIQIAFTGYIVTNNISSSLTANDLTCSNTIANSNQYAGYLNVSVTNANPGPFSTSFNAQTGVMSITYNSFNSNTSSQFDLEVAIDCSVIQASSSTSSLKLEQVWSVNSTAVTLNINSTPTSNLACNSNQCLQAIASPFLSYSGSNSLSFDVYYNQPKELEFEFQNTGNVPNNESSELAFQFYLETGCTSAVSINNNGLHTYIVNNSNGIVQSTGSFDPLNTSQWTDIEMEQGDILIIKLQVNIIGCIAGCGNLNARLKWKCSDNPPNPVFSCSNCVNNGVGVSFQLTTPAPNITITQSTIPPDAGNCDHTCFGVNDKVEWRYTYTNSGLEEMDKVIINLTNFQGDISNILTNVDKADISIDITNCSNCTLQNPDTKFFTANECATSTTIWSDTWEITGFEGGSSFVFIFKTFKCSDDTPVLYNLPKFFNKWQLKTNVRDICQNKVNYTLSNIGTFSDYGYPISSHTGIPMDMDLHAEFTPQVAMTAVPPLQFVGPMEEQFIELDKLFPLYQGIPSGCGDEQLVGINSANNALTYNGYLRVKIHTESGLGLEQGNLAGATRIEKANFIWNPVYFYSSAVLDANSSLCPVADYYFYYDLSQIILDQTTNFFNGGKLYFNLQGCCGNGAPIEYSVMMDIIPNPSSQCCSTTIPPANGGELTFSSPNDCKWIPLKQWDDVVMQVTCPGCSNPGIEINAYKMERTSLGWPDADLNLIPDNNQPLSWEPNSGYNTHYANHGDALLDRQIGQLSPGGTANGGYTLSQISGAGANVPDVLQLHRQITKGGFAVGAMNLQPKSIKLLIDEPVAPGQTPGPVLYSSQFSDMIDPNTYAANYQTVWAIELDDSDPVEWGKYVEVYYANGGEDLVLFLTFSNDIQSIPSTVNMNDHLTAGSGTFTGFTPNQKFRLMVEYHVCGNFNPANPANFNDCRKESVITTHMWVTGKKHEYDPNITYPSPEADPLLANVPFLNYAQGTTLGDLNNYINDYMFRCRSGFGYFYFLSTEALNESLYGWPDLLNLCKRVLGIRFLSRIGGSTSKNLFPGEFKTPPFVPSKITAKAPGNGYSLGNFSAQARYLCYTNQPEPILCTGTVPISGFNVNNTTPPFFIIDIDDGTSGNLPYPLCNPVTPGNTTYRAGHQQSGLDVDAELIMNQCINGQVIYPETTDVVIEYTDYSSFGNVQQHYCNTPTVATNTPCVSALPVSIPSSEISKFCLITKNGLDFDFPTPDIETYTTEVEWPITITNPEVDIDPGNPVNMQPEAAYHVYLKVPDNNTNPEFTNWKLKNVATGTIITPDVNYVFQISNQLASSNDLHLYTLSATYDCITSPLSFNVFWGWDCEEFPTFTPLDPVPCLMEPQTLTIDKKSTVLSSQGKSMPGYHLCQPFDKSAEIKVTQGALYPPLTVEVLDLDPHVYLNSVSIQKCSTSTNVVPLLPNPVGSLLFTCDGSDLQNAGFPVPFINQGECIEVTLSLTADFNFNLTNALVPEIKLTGKDFCEVNTEHTATLSAWAPPQSPSACQYNYSVNKSSLLQTIAPYETASYDILICNTTANVGNVELMDLLPANFVVTSPSPCTWCQTPGGGTATPLVISPPLAANACTTLTVEGFFTTESNCIDNLTFNTAQIFFSSAPGMPSTMVEDDYCIEVSCAPAGTISLSTANNLNTSSLLIALNGGNPQLTGFTFYVTGTFTVDADIEFINCTLYMAPGAEIVVGGGFSLTTNNTRVSGCTNMWSRIWVLDESSVKILNNSEIRDANDAIWAEDGSRVTIDQSSVFESVRGLFIPPSSTGSFHNNLVVRITGSTFGRQNSPGFKPGYSGQPTPGAIPNSGIEVNDMPMITIGDDAMGTNRFVNMSNGIVAHRSLRVLVQNSAYENIWADAAYNSAHNGSTVVSLGDQALHRNGDLTVRPAATGSTMHHCNRGIYTEYSNLRATGLTMTEMRTGVYSTRCTDMLRTEVTGCSIAANFRGIDWYDNDGAAYMRAENNEIVISGNPNGIAIAMDETNPAGGDANYEIKNNYRIEITSATGGIVARNVNNAVIENNYIIQNSDGVSYPKSGGMVVDFGNNNEIMCNTVISTDPNYTGSFGLFNRNSANTIGCNNFQWHETGVFFGGNLCDGTLFSGNKMHNHYVGLYLNSNALIGQQPIGGTPPYHGNRWTGSFSSGFGAANMNWQPTTNLSLNLFTTRSIASGGLPQHNPVIPGINPNVFGVDNTTWFDYLPLGSTIDCDLSTICNPQQLTGGGDDEQLQLYIARDSTLTSGYVPESKSMSRQRLYEALKKDSSLLYSDSTFVQFMAAHQYSAVGFLHEARRYFSYLGMLDSASIDTLNGVYQTIALYTDSLALLDSLALADTTLDFSQNIQNIHSLIAQQLQISIAMLINLRTADSLNLLNAQIQNQVALSGELPLQNERAVNDITMNYYRSGRDSILSRYSELWTIAHQCPYSGGNAVIRARILLRTVNDSIAYDDQPVCLSEGYYRQSQTTTKPSTKERIRVVPNPASTLAEVILEGYSSGMCYLSISDMMGKEQMRERFECEKQSHTVNLSSLNPGIYIVAVRVNLETTQFTKLIVVR